MILVFGSGGQVGRELARLADLFAFALTGLTREQADISNRLQVEKALAAIRPQVVINVAALSDADRAEREVWQALRVNATGPEVLAEVCAGARIPLVHLSTNHVFSGSKSGAYIENDPIAPLGVYGRSKAAGEAAIRGALPEHVIVRTSWLYGIHGTNFLKSIMKLAGECDEVELVADQRGCPTSANDLAEALLTVAQRLKEGGTDYGTFHFAGCGATTWHGFAQRIVAAQKPFTGRNPAVTPVPGTKSSATARNPMNAELDSSLFTQIFGYAPRPWETMVDETVAQVCQGQGTLQVEQKATAHHHLGKPSLAEWLDRIEALYGPQSGKAAISESVNNEASMSSPEVPRPRRDNGNCDDTSGKSDTQLERDTLPTAHRASETQQSNLRTVRRDKVWQSAKIVFGSNIVDCIVRDFSVAGAGIVVKNPESLPRNFDLHIAANNHRVWRARLRWHQNGIAGVSFHSNDSIIASRGRL